MSLMRHALLIGTPVSPTRQSASDWRRLLYRSLASHERFNLLCLHRKIRREVLGTVVGDQKIIFDPHPERLIGQVDPRFVGDHHARLERILIRAGIMSVEAERMAEAVDEILSERFSL